MHCSVMGYEALRAAVANYKGEAWVDDHEEGALVCKCFGVDEGMIERAIRMNRLTVLEMVGNYTKATGGCGTCAEGVEKILARVNAEMVAQGEITAEAAYVPGASLPPARVKKAKPKPAAAPAVSLQPGKLTNLQRIRMIEESIEELRPTFKRDGGDCELVEVEEDCVFVRMTGACSGCQMEALTLQGVQARIMEKLGKPMKVIPVQARH
jgi:NifU-like protein